MFWDHVNTRLFRPLCSRHSAVYARILWFLYNKMVINWYESSDWTPKDCRDAVQQCLLEMNQRIDWTEEDHFILGTDLNSERQVLMGNQVAGSQEFGFDDIDDASRIYRYLKESGWIKEIEETGYRRVAYMPKLASGLLASLDDLTKIKRSNIGARCQNIYLALNQAVDDPKTHGLQVEVAAEHARDFCTQLSTMAAACRELAHGIMEETNTAKVLSRFFNDFIKGTLLEDYSTLKSRDHPYRFRAATLELLNRTLSNERLLQALEEGILAAGTFQKENATAAGQSKVVRVQLVQDLQDIYKCFQRIDEIMQKIEHYRCTMTRRTREALQYAMSTPVFYTRNLDEVIKGLAATSVNINELIDVPAPLYRDDLLSNARGYRPRRASVSAEILPLVKGQIPQSDIDFNHAMDEYYLRRSENKDRLRSLIERHLGASNSMSSDEISIHSLDDFIAFLQLRDLLHDAVPPSSPFYELLEDYQVKANHQEITSNEFLIAPQLVIERRRRSLNL